ncbi:MAG: class I SAM-dependent methyltransferase [Saprospiraceae bacterium]|nr:class I SAM-dependent methyltransferase [Saprospiraceae bacterium]MCB9322158.1 class I SAM-dependent methyltransferase [Lewinellaceae bacterium]
MNYFQPKNTAERYASGRPDFHENTIGKVKQDLGIQDKLDKALDVACGTGLSTRALLKIADNIFGTDSSEEMLRFAHSNDRINYSVSTAENQPFPDSEFDIITVCSAIHWFNIDDFLLEASRLLKNDAYLVIYDNFFISEMKENEDFKHWFPNVYLKRFPSPVRNNNYDWDNGNLKRSHFILEKEVSFNNEVSFSKEKLMLYFTTQSNITAAIKQGSSYEEVEDWLNTELAPFFEDNKVTKTIYFGNWVKYLKRNH